AGELVLVVQHPGRTTGVPHGTGREVSRMRLPPRGNRLLDAAQPPRGVREGVEVGRRQRRVVGLGQQGNDVRPCLTAGGVPCTLDARELHAHLRSWSPPAYWRPGAVSRGRRGSGVLAARCRLTQRGKDPPLGLVPRDPEPEQDL